MTGSFARLLMSLLLALLSLPAYAHVGSKDVFEEVTAGSYKLYVTIRPPTVIPGVATVEIRTSGAPLKDIDITPLPMAGEGAKHPPAPDRMKQSAVDKAFYTGSLWLMQSGSWQVRIGLDGDGGARTVSVPLPAASLAMAKMKPGLAILLSAMGLLLVCGMAGIVAAAFGEAQLEPGQAPTPSLRRRGRVAMAISLLCMGGVLWTGALWWHVAQVGYSGDLYHPLTVHSELHGDTLDIRVGSVQSDLAFKARLNNDFILDHGKVMHLYAVREPELDAVYHLHPDLVAAGDFRLELPAMPPGKYKLYGDVVHFNGFPETLVSTMTVPPGLQGRPLYADDASGSPAPLSAGELGSSYRLPDGYSMVWAKPQTLSADTGYLFHFELLDPQGKPPAHMRAYLGMAGHAAFLNTDGTVFAHVHPEGSAAMAAVMLANNGGETLAPSAAAVRSSSDSTGSMGGMAAMGGMEGMTMPADANLDSNVVEFPYGFPTPGRYRIFVQMKHDAVVETGAFDAVVK